MKNYLNEEKKSIHTCVGQTNRFDFMWTNVFGMACITYFGEDITMKNALVFAGQSRFTMETINVLCDNVV